MRTVLILGGTTEARHLADALALAPGLEVVYSLAGRVSAPRLPAGSSRVGGFGGAEAMAEWLSGHDVGAVVDATHPFAERISASAVEAARIAAVPLLVLRRPSWEPDDADVWHVVESLPEAARALERFGERVFLTTGRQGLRHFADVDRWFLVRCVSAPESPMPARMDLLLARGPFTLHGELALMRDNAIDVVVTKDSGGTAAAAKLAAARELGLPVVMVRRPVPKSTPSVSTIGAALDWVGATLASRPSAPA